jgi:hypothetical protein
VASILGRMETRARWVERVKGWRASGQTSTEYSEGKPFTAGGLRHWSYRLGMTRRRAGRTRVRLARVVPIKAPEAKVMGVGAVRRAVYGEEPSSSEESAAVVVEMGKARVAVRPGFDRATLGAVLDVLRESGGSR